MHPAVPCGQVCPCVNQPQPCYCEERAGYSHLGYDSPLTIDTNIEYELKGLQTDTNGTGSNDDNNSCQRALLIDYSNMPGDVRQQQQQPTVPCEPHQSYWGVYPQETFTQTPADPHSYDLYHMIGTILVYLCYSRAPFLFNLVDVRSSLTEFFYSALESLHPPCLRDRHSLTSALIGIWRS